MVSNDRQAFKVKTGSRLSPASFNSFAHATSVHQSKNVRTNAWKADLLQPFNRAASEFGNIPLHKRQGGLPVDKPSRQIGFVLIGHSHDLGLPSHQMDAQEKAQNRRAASHGDKNHIRRCTPRLSVVKELS